MADWLHALVYARHVEDPGLPGGVNLWGASPLYVNPVNMLNILTKVLAEEQVLRSRLVAGGRNREGRSGGSLRQSCEPEPVPDLIRGTETAYKAQSPGKSASFDFAQGALSLPNGHHVTKPWIQETCLPKAGRVVARGDQECRGCAVKVHVLIRGDLSHMR